MSTYKIYQIIDANKSIYSFRLPDSKKHVDFTSMTFGSKFADGKLTYGTNDPEIQKAIENMPKFKSGVITIEREVEQEEVGSKKKTTPPPTGSPLKKGEKKENPSASLVPLEKGQSEENEVVEGPTNPQEAKDWLKANKGIAPVALNSLEKVKAQAEKAGVSFPNVVWPE